ncbi:BCL2 associated agonist of cell death b [Osmerus mordax]|uniref:BCL2 associated agonist of cell death b n=1 Tax=Osmerus mordax TaxID=8014 RepID=UPI00350F7049
MATMYISDSESESSEEGGETNQSETGDPLGPSLTVPVIRLPGGGRVRVNSESHASHRVDLDQDLQARGPSEAGMPTEGAPFRVRSRSAPPALWAAKKYGRQLRRYSDDFDNLLDKGEMRRVRSESAARPMLTSPSWWNYLFSHQETEGESNHANLASSDRTE